MDSGIKRETWILFEMDAGRRLGIMETISVQRRSDKVEKYHC